MHQSIDRGMAAAAAAAVVVASLLLLAAVFWAAKKEELQYTHRASRFQYNNSHLELDRSGRLYLRTLSISLCSLYCTVQRPAKHAACDCNNNYVRRVRVRFLQFDFIRPPPPDYTSKHTYRILNITFKIRLPSAAKVAADQKTSPHRAGMKSIPPILSPNASCRGSSMVT